MIKKVIQTNNAPKAIGPYSQGIAVESESGVKTVYLSGQIPLDPQTMSRVTGDFKAQCLQVLKNLTAMTKAAGGDPQSIVKLTVYLTDLQNFAALNELLSEYFQQPYPARTTIEVSALPKDAEVELDAIMVIKS